MIDSFRRYKRRGVAAIFSLVMLVVLIGFTALTIDVGYIYNTRAELQNTADAAAMAATQMLPDQAEAHQTALDYANANNFQYGAVVDATGVDLGRWDFLSASFTPGGVPVNAVRVHAHRSDDHDNAVSLFFAPIFGKQATEVSASATAAYGRSQRWDVVITQDVTGSFTDEIDEARLADQDLLDCIRDHAPETELGLVTFTGFGQTLATLKNVQDDYSSLSTSIANIDNCGSSGMPPCSGTNIGAGLDEAISLLSTSTSAGLPKAIILVSDGMPASSSGNPGYSDEDLADWAEASADEAAALDISIFTLFYSGNDGSSEAEEFLGSLVRGDGTAHVTADPDEIGEKLQEICREGMNFMLVE